MGALAASAALGGRLATPAAAFEHRVAVEPSGARRASLVLPEFRRRVGVADFPWLADLSPTAVSLAPAWQAPLPAPAPGQEPPPVIQFDIPAGPLADVVAAFERATGMTVTFATPAFASVQSPGVSGLLAPADALTRLLDGTGASPTQTSPTAITLGVGGVSESVNVSGARVRVESPSYARPVSETPQTIQVIPRQVMEAQGVTTLSEALRNVPGISLQAGEGGGASSTTGDMFNLRGFSANNSLFVDGVRDDGLISRDVFNLEQVDVFLGPTGTDVGRGTAAGYVNMTTKTPLARSLYAGTVGIGTAEQKRVTVDVNQAVPLGGADSWWRGTAFRLNGLVQDSGVPGRDHAELATKAVAPSLALGLGTRVRLAAGGQFVEQDNVPDYGVPAAAWPDGPLTPTGSVASRPVAQDTYYGSPAVDYDRVSQDSIYGRLEIDLRPDLRVRNQTRHNRTHRAALITAIASPASYNAADETVTLARQANERENEITSNQTSLTALARTGAVRHALTATLEVTHDAQFAPTLAGTGTRGPVSIYDPDPFEPVSGLAVARTGAYTDGSTSTLALSVFDAVDLTSRLQVSGGLRWERYETAFLAVNATGAHTTDARAEDSLVSGKVGLLYKLTDQGNAYVSFGTSKTPPGTANFTLSTQPNNANNPNVDPQESSNLEVGSKWDFYGGRLSLNGAVFHTKNTNVIFTVDATAVPPVFNQDDAQQVDGVSLSVSGRITRDWDVQASFAYLDSENQSQNQANAGRRLALTPETSGSLWTTYRTPIGLTLGGGIRRLDDVFVNAANTIRVPGVTIVDLMATYPIINQISLRLNVYNLSDEVYIRNVNNNGGRYNPGQPRTAVVTASFAF